MTHKLLIIEDDSSLAFVLKDTLLHKGYKVVNYYDGQTALESFKANHFDLAIIDVMLPMVDGFALAEHFKSVDPEVAIMFLTARSNELDKIKGFHAGADDYLTKPFSVEELLLRIKAVLKRNNRPAENIIGKFFFSRDQQSLKIGAKEVQLTQRESDLLHYLILHKNELVKREEILKKIWGDDDYFMGRSLDVYISKLRKYLELDRNIEIKNYHGVGFKLICQK